MNFNVCLFIIISTYIHYVVKSEYIEELTKIIDDSKPYGVVDFPNSCNPNVADQFNTAVSMLYSFWYI